MRMTMEKARAKLMALALALALAMVMAKTLARTAHCSHSSPTCWWACTWASCLR